MRRRNVCFILVAGIGLIVGMISLIPADAADMTELLFVSNRTGNLEIFIAGADCANAKNLTNNPADDRAPAWSPDGSMIAFDSDRSGNRDIYVMDPYGSNVKQLTNNPDLEGAPSWSPDGKKIAFCRVLNGNNPEIFVMNADGSNQINLTNDSPLDSDPAWAPNGKKISFASRKPGQGYRLFLMDPDGSNLQMLPVKDTGSGWVYPAWSPDAKKIAYSDGVGSGIEIFVCDVEGGTKKQLTTIGGVNCCAAWSPDGKRIAFQQFDRAREPGALWIMDADGATQNQVIASGTPFEGGRPAWRPLKH